VGCSGAPSLPQVADGAFDLGFFAPARAAARNVRNDLGFRNECVDVADEIEGLLVFSSGSCGGANMNEIRITPLLRISPPPPSLIGPVPFAHHAAANRWGIPHR